MRPIAVGSVLASLWGCSGFPKVIVQGDDPKQSLAAECAEVELKARESASRFSTLGWATAVLAFGSFTAGSTVIPLAGEGEGMEGGLSTEEKITAASLTAGSVALAALSRALFKRSDAASVLAGETALSIAEEADPIKLTSRCNKAISAWEASRADAGKLADALLQQERKDNEDDKTKAAKADALADENHKLKKINIFMGTVLKTKGIDTSKLQFDDLEIGDGDVPFEEERIERPKPK